MSVSFFTFCCPEHIHWRCQNFLSLFDVCAFSIASPVVALFYCPKLHCKLMQIHIRRRSTNWSFVCHDTIFQKTILIIVFLWFCFFFSALVFIDDSFSIRQAPSSENLSPLYQTDFHCFFLLTLISEWLPWKTIHLHIITMNFNNKNFLVF